MIRGVVFDSRVVVSNPGSGRCTAGSPGTANHAHVSEVGKRGWINGVPAKCPYVRHEMHQHVLNCIKMNIVLDLRAIYGHFAGTPFIQPRLASVKCASLCKQN